MTGIDRTLICNLYVYMSQVDDWYRDVSQGILQTESEDRRTEIHLDYIGKIYSLLL